MPLDVMSFNIRYGTANDGEYRWEARKDGVAQVLQTERPHLLGLQEALDFQLREVKQMLPGFQAVGVGRDDGKSAGEFAAILFDTSRLSLMRSDTFWFSDTPNVPGSKHWGNNDVRACTWAYFRDLETGSYFYLYNLHLDHLSQPSRRRVRA